MAEQKADAVIIGAGLTGLVTAYCLSRKGKDVKIIEKRDRPGGVIQSMEKSGFLYEKGPNTGVLGNPEVIQLFDDLKDECKLEKARAEAKKRLVLKNGKWEPLPTGLMEAIKTPLFSLGDKFRILGEPFRKPGKNPDENLADMVKRRMGKSFLDYAVDPFILGIYAGDPGYLIPKYALPKLYNLEQNYGSFIKGAIKKKSEPKTELEKRADRSVFSVKGGLESLVGALYNKTGTEKFIFNAASVTTEYHGKELIGVHFKLNGKNQTIETSKVIITTGAHEMRQILPFIKTTTMDTIDNLQYAKVIEVAVGYRKWEGIALDAFGGLIPFRENRDILGVLFLSSFLENRAPDGGALMAVFMGGMRKPELVQLSDEQVKKVLTHEFKELMGVHEFQPDLLEITRYEHAIPQYGIDSKKRLEAISKIEREYPGLIIAGNSIEGIGIADRIKQGMLKAREI